MKKMFLAGVAVLSISISGAANAQNEQASQDESAVEAGVKELDAFSKIFENMFKKDDTPIDPAMLSKGERIAGAVVPKGSYRKVMAETFKTMIEPMMAGLDEMPLSAIAAFAGVGEDDIKLKEGATLSDLMMIVDPYFKQRNRAMMNSIADIMIDLSDDIEPSIRQGMARAYARRFSADELEAAAEFYETEAGAKFAGESLSIYTSPEVMSASMEMMPQFMERFMGVMGEMSKGNGDIPPPRSFNDLSDEEKDKFSELLGIDREELGAPNLEELAEMAEEIAEDLDEEAAWNDPANWSAEERATVERLESESEVAFDKYYDAQEAARENAKKRLKKD